MAADEAPTVAAELSMRLGVLELTVELRSGARRIAVSGPSGSGKTTFLRLLCGLLRPDRGTLAALGETWSDPARRVHVPPWRRGVGWVPQDALLFPHRTVRENLAYNSTARDAELRAMAAWLGVAELLDRRPRHLSGGERQRVALGRALLARPRLLLLDEPFSALEPPLRERLARELRERCDDARLPLVLVSHDDAPVELLAEERYEIRGGRLGPAVAATGPSP
jgi:molybdate transport system ATP-binding protein